MNGLPDAPDPGQRPVYESRRFRRGSSGSPVAKVLVAIVALAILGGGGWWAWRTFLSGEDVPAGAARSVPATPAEPAASAPEPRPADLPELDASDALVRSLAGGISAHPQVAEWFVTDDLVRRFVVAVVRVANGGRPGPRVDFLAPEGDFTVLEEDDRVLLDPASYGRYDLVTTAFTSLDTEGGAELYRRLRPLFQDAYRELGQDGSFDEQTAAAIRLLTSVEIPEGPLELVQNEAVWEYADPALEDLTPAEKHLLRMGPRNARRIQEKLRALGEAVGLTP